jgi:hypothetical protein
MNETISLYLSRSGIPVTQIIEGLLQACKTFSIDRSRHAMLNCAVPGCSTSQHALRSGRLHLIDTPVEAGSTESRKKYVWLCAECSETHVVQTWRAAGEQIRSKVPHPVLAFPPQSETAEPRRLQLVQNAS